MNAEEYRDYLAPLYEGRKFKGLQVVYFFNNEQIEQGVIIDCQRIIKSTFQPEYTIVYMNYDFVLDHVQVDEEDIFSTWDAIADYCKKTMNESRRYHTLKHHQEVYAGIDDFMGMPIDEFIITGHLKIEL